MSVHSRRISILGQSHLTTVNITVSLAKQIPASTYVGSGYSKATTVFRGFAVEAPDSKVQYVLRSYQPECMRPQAPHAVFLSAVQE